MITMIGPRVRSFPDKNYWAVFNDGVTVRFTFEKDKPIGELDYPEFLDIKVTSRCTSGMCKFCYMSSVPNVEHPKDIVKKFLSHFEPMTMNQRPFQIAYGGGCCEEHPEFCDLLEATCRLGIMPNYTTNGVYFCGNSPEVEKTINTTIRLCGGIALSTHHHLDKYWTKAARMFRDLGQDAGFPLKVNLHHIVSDKESIQRLIAIYQEFKSRIDYFVILPLVAQGRATEEFHEEQFLFDTLRELPDLKQFAFGAKLYPALLRAKAAGRPLPVMLYEPEVMSKFIDMKDMKVYPSSFDLAKAEASK